MAGALVELNIDDREVKDLLDRLASRMSNLTPVMKEIGEIVTESVQTNFEEHKSPEGVAWTPLADSTKAYKEKKGRKAEDILIMSAILLKSIHPEAYNDSVEIGTDIVYAAVHQFGIGERSGISTHRRMPAIPARPFLGVREEDWTEIENMLMDELFEGI
jgi:phage virion morphogenesis protein